MNDNARHDGDDYDVWKNPSLDGNLFFGKWFGPKLGARINFSGGTLHPFFQNERDMEHEKYISGRIDLLLNLTNLFREYSSDRFYNLSPYVGIGGAYAFNAKNRPDNAKNSSSLMFGGGLYNTFRLSNRISVYLDLGMNVVDAKFDGWKEDESFNGMLSPTLGIVYKFGKSKAKEVVTYYREEPQPQPQPQPQQEPQPQPQQEPPQTPPKIETPAPPRFIDNVYFKLDSPVIDADQQVNIKKAADFLKANPDAIISVIGYADEQTGNPNYNLGLSEKRAKNVTNELVDRYKVNINRLKIDWKGDTVQPYIINDRNRVVTLLSE